jgi:hypothetical protein
MRISILAASALAAAALVPTARAQTTVIERSSPSVTIERREAPTVIERRSVETTGSVDCSTKTTTKTNEFGDTKTVRKERCD